MTDPNPKEEIAVWCKMLKVNTQTFVIREAAKSNCKVRHYQIQGGIYLIHQYTRSKLNHANK